MNDSVHGLRTRTPCKDSHADLPENGEKKTNEEGGDGDQFAHRPNAHTRISTISQLSTRDEAR